MIVHVSAYMVHERRLLNGGTWEKGFWKLKSRKFVFSYFTFLFLFFLYLRRRIRTIHLMLKSYVKLPLRYTCNHTLLLFFNKKAIDKNQLKNIVNGPLFMHCNS